METTLAERVLVPRLRTYCVAATGGVHNEVAAPGASKDQTGAPTPYVIVHEVSARDVVSIGGYRAGVEITYLVKGVVQGTSSFAAVEVVDQQIDEALQGHKTTFEGKAVSVTRLSPYKLVQERDGIYSVHLGGEYRVFVH